MRYARLERAYSLILLAFFFGVACGRGEAPPAPPSTAAAPAPRAAQPTAAQQRLREIAAIPARAKNPDMALAELQPWLANEDRDAREAAILALWDIETRDANRALAEMARNDKDPEIKSYALEELVDREAPEAYETLTVLLSDPDSDLREQAAEGLETLDEERATKQLYAQLKTERDEWVRDAIISALESLDPDFDEDGWEVDSARHSFQAAEGVARRLLHAGARVVLGGLGQSALHLYVLQRLDGRQAHGLVVVLECPHERALQVAVFFVESGEAAQSLHHHEAVVRVFVAQRLNQDPLSGRIVLRQLGEALLDGHSPYLCAGIA